MFAIVPNLSQYTPGDYLTQQNVPWFGWAFDATYCSPTPSTSLYGFGYNGCLIPPDPKRMPDSRWPALQVREREDGREEADARDVLERDRLRRNSVATQASGYAGAGFDVVYVKGLLPPPPLPDVTPYVQELLHVRRRRTARRDGVPAVRSTACPSTSSCGRTTTRAPIQSPLYSDLLAGPLEGSVASVQLRAVRGEHAAQQQMIEDIHAFKSGAAINSGVAASYFAADMFITR